MRFALLRPRGAALVFLLAGLLLSGCDSSSAPTKEKKIEVNVTTPIHEQVVDYQDFTGRMDAFRTVEIRARVNGYVVKAPFQEGEIVEKDDILFEIDPRPYEVIVEQAIAEVATRKAQTEKAEAMYRRSLTLLPTKIATQEDVDNQKGDWDVARANILLSEAKLREARLNLSFCRVIAPHRGRVSRRSVDPGNLVKADETILTSVVRDDSVYAYFDVDERTYLDLVGESPTSQANARLKEKKLPVLMCLANAEEFTYPGYVDFLDNRLNGNTGTIRMRAVFENPLDTYKSGLFVRVRLPIGQPYRAQLVADEAIQSDQGRKYVYVVQTDAENKEVVEYRRVFLGQSLHGLRVINDVKKEGPFRITAAMLEHLRSAKVPENVVAKVQPLKDKAFDDQDLLTTAITKAITKAEVGQWRRAIVNQIVAESNGKVIEGLLDGERVIISGMQRVHPGTTVTVKLEAPPKPPGFAMESLFKSAAAPAPEDKETTKQAAQVK